MATFNTCDVSGYDVTDMKLFSRASYNRWMINQSINQSTKQVYFRQKSIVKTK